jgi:hypothetical protein
MAVVVPFQEVLQHRRRQQERACSERCVEIIESTLAAMIEMFHDAPPAERPFYARRVRQLSELLEYAVHTL